MSKYNLVAGIDIGNGYTKGLIRPCGSNAEPQHIDFPSGVAYVTNSHDIKASDEGKDAVIGDIYNQMDVGFYSPTVQDGARRLFGRRGITSGMTLEEFDVSSSLSKAMQPLSFMLTLGCFAGYALQLYWAEYKSLPVDGLKVDAYVALALPISEYKKYRKAYADNFKQRSHTVNFYNFEEPVSVEVMFVDVQIQAEGASAQYAISDRGLPLMESMLADVRRFDKDILPGITASDVLAAQNTVGIDVGEGTVNFPVFQDGSFNPDASLTFGSGYGTVLSKALDRLREDGFPFGSRKMLADFLVKPPSALNKARYDKVQIVVSEEVVAFAKEISMQFLKVMGRAGAYAEVTYVYGGGATPVKDPLHRLLIDTARNLGAGSEVPVLYLDSRYSRYLNREGLFRIAELVYAKLSQSQSSVEPAMATE